jgi:hypothetical protein
MKMAKVRMTLAFAGCLALAAASIEAQQGEMSAEQKAAMEAWTKAMTPGAEHQKMAGMVGTWNATVTMWEAPGAPPQTSQAVSKRRMALGGRVMVDEWAGNMMGMPFEGLGHTGFDNVTQRWWGTWSDNMTTGVMTTSGTCDADPTKGCTHVGKMVNMMTGKEEQNRQTVKWPNADEEVFEMFGPGPDGKEYQMMKIVSKRAK